MPLSGPTSALANIDPSDAFLREEREDRPVGTLRAELRRAIEDAKTFYEQELLKDQVDATNRYHGRPFGDEQPGRSKIVSTDVRDAVEAIMPSLLRIFLATDAPVEFQPHGIEDVPICRQQTDTVNYVVRHYPESFKTFMAWFEDALVRRIGIITWFHEEREISEQERYENLTVEQLRVLADDKSVSGVEAAQSPDSTEELELFDALVERRRAQHRFCYDVIPNEEFSWSPDAPNLDEAVCVYWSQKKTVAELVSMGMDRALVMQAAHSGNDQTRTGSDLGNARQFHGNASVDDTGRGRGNQSVLYTRAYFLTETEDGKAQERRFFELLGPEYVPVDEEGEVVSEMVPFAIITPRPMAHMIAGLSVDDFLASQQRINSQLQRGLFDSLSKALDNDTFVDINRVSVEDLEDPSANRTIRVDGPVPNAVLHVNHSFVGKEIIPVLQWSDEQTEKKMGITKASRGLDADSLQSATKIAVAGTLERAQERIDGIARAFAETGVTRFFKGMLRMIVEHQDRPMVVRLRGNYTEVDPRDWNTDFDCIPNVGLGTGIIQDRIQLLRDIVIDQNTLMLNGAPIVDWTTMRRSREEIVRLAGFMSADEFYLPFGPEQQQAYAQAQAQAAQSGAKADPADVLLANVEREKAQMKLQTDQAKLQIEMAKVQIARQKMETDSQIAAMRLELDKAKAAADQAIKMITAQASAETPVTVQEMKSETEIIKTEMQVESQQVIAERQSMDKARDRAANVAVEGARLAEGEKDRRQASSEADKDRKSKASDGDK